MTKIRIGTRKSKLAMAQSKLVADAIKAHWPDVEIELVPMTTTGDRLPGPLDKMGGKGLFVKELDAALYERRTDLSVHSYKDVPIEVDPNIPILAVGRRDYTEDVLVLPKNGIFDTSKPIGTASVRRALQIKLLYPEIETKHIRGNIFTRLDKLETGEYGALILARAGLMRMGLNDRVHHIFTPDEMIPASCQGVLAVQGRKDFDKKYLKGFHCEESWFLCQVERSFIRTLDGGCSSPCCCHAAREQDMIRLRALYSRDNKTIVTKTALSEPELAIETAIRLAENIAKA